MNALLLVSAGVTIFLGVLSLALVLHPGNTSARRLRAVTATEWAATRRSQQRRNTQQTLLRVARQLRERIGLSESDRLRARFVSAGLRTPGAMELYFAARMLGPVAAIIAASFIHSSTFLWVTGSAAFAYLAPDFWLDHVIKSRRERIRRSIPDAVDLLVICVEAGLGLDQAMVRAGVELSLSHPDINDEFLQINREQRAGKPRMEAWRAMADRTALPEAVAFTGMLVQTERFGTPIARALSTFADSLREKRRQRAEEQAAKTTVKMIFPLVLFIFPSMFIVLLAPAILDIAQSLTGLGH
jgi:tight adherence protein C